MKPLLSIWLASLMATALLAGCRTRIGADQTPVSHVYRERHHSALDGGGLSDFTRGVLHRYDADKTFRAHPTEVLKQLHEQVLADESRDLLLALAELNYLRADELRHSVKPGEPRGARDYFLLSSVYAYYYLLAETTDPQVPQFELRPQLARDLYNYGLAQGLWAAGTTNPLVLLQEGTRRLPVGSVEIALNTNAFPWSLNMFSEFVMADAFVTRGLTVRNRQTGLGAPLVATGGLKAGELAPPRLAVSVFLRMESNFKEWRTGQVHASLEVYPGYPATQVTLGGHHLPLEIDATAPLAYALNNPALWKLGRQQFFSSREIVKSGVYRMQPYRVGAIPVVFVHGTFSSPVYWAEMWNTLVSDPVLSRRCQFWAFVYNSGNPVLWSAANLRDALVDLVNTLDPDGTDPALRQMVVIGHSQGGLLAKLTVTRTQDKLWRLVSEENLDNLEMSDGLRAELRRTLFIEPVPGVTRVVFVATPHRGSFRATGFVRKLAAKLVSFPSKLVGYVPKPNQPGGTATLPPVLRGRIPTSLDGMSPQNVGLLTLAEMAPATGVTSHSIIAVKGHRAVEQDNDGVVSYQSAHVAYSASERVVRSPHSCQNKPATIEEVRRILLAHLAAFDEAAASKDPRQTSGKSPTGSL